MIKFIVEDTVSDNPTFGDVEVGQFFINDQNYFCQKVGGTQYNIIADADGAPTASQGKDQREATSIKQILPQVLKIEFPGMEK